MMSNALVPMGDMGLSDTMILGETLAKSGYFSDAKEAAQAVVKILAGRELGFGAIASMTGISIIKGQVSIGANLMAAAIKRDPRYDYRVAALDGEHCEIVFYQDSVELGRSTFSKADAQTAGLMNATWTKFTRNMLFARALSNGARWYCPDACGGAPVYTPEELGAPVDGDGNVITVTPTAVTEPTTTPEPPEDAGSNGIHWIDKVDKHGREIRPAFWAWAKNTMALTEAQVYEALGVEHIHDYTGTMGDAKTAITKWVAEQSVEQPELA
jgi:hypothetical protein